MFAKPAGIGALIKLLSSKQQNNNVLYCFSNFLSLSIALLSFTATVTCDFIISGLVPLIGLSSKPEHGLSCHSALPDPLFPSSLSTHFIRRAF